MKTTEINRISKNGGYAIDRRLKQNKILIDKIKSISIEIMRKVSQDFNICPELTLLRFKDISVLLNADHLKN